MEQDVRFANVDLELESGNDLQSLLDDLRGEINISYHGRLESGDDFAAVVLSSTKFGRQAFEEPNEQILAFCHLLESVSESSIEIWRACKRKEFDAGFESGDTEKTFAARIEQRTIRKVANLGATIRITIYPIRKSL